MKIKKFLEKHVQPATGCTEPIAVGYATALAYHALYDFPEEASHGSPAKVPEPQIKSVEKIVIKTDRNIYKNAKAVSIPGTNTTYKKEILQELGGFDPHFVTAEDIDLNLRAVDAGYKIYFEKDAIVYRYARENALSFLKQAFRNGYGRKQLALKHGKLWGSYSPKQMFGTHLTFWGILRLLFGLLGYLTCKLTGGGMRKHF